MQDDEATRRKLAEIGARFLARTSSEIAQLEESVRQLSSDVFANLKQVELIAHRMRGSGAVFGFESISEAAGHIEMLAVQALNHGDENVAVLSTQLSSAIEQLTAKCTKASRSPPNSK